MLTNKTIFQLADEGTVVFSNSDIDVLITINGSSLNWWYLEHGENTYYLYDSLYVNSDLKILSISAARKLAKDWFDEEVKVYSMGAVAPAILSHTNSHGMLECEPPLECKLEEDMSKKKHHNKIKNKIDLMVNKIYPLYIFANKKDAHTEHCCFEHKYCLYGNKKCSVILGKKKPSYQCKCDSY